MTAAVPSLALLALVGLAGCSASDDGPSTAATSAPSTTTTTGPTTTTLPLPTYEGRVGSTITTPYTNRLTLHAFENPAQRMYEPEAGYFYVAADMESCVSESYSGGDAAAAVDFFVLQTDKHARITGRSGRRPEIDARTLRPGECVRGWVTFEVPQDQRPVSLLYTVVGGTTLRWNL